MSQAARVGDFRTHARGGTVRGFHARRASIAPAPCFSCGDGFPRLPAAVRFVVGVRGRNSGPSSSPPTGGRTVSVLRDRLALAVRRPCVLPAGWRAPPGLVPEFRPHAGLGTARGFYAR